MKIVVLSFIFLILASLGSALYFMVRDKGSSHRTARALTWRVALSILLFALLMLGFHFGFIPAKL
ncbi:MAG: twin transmembrane helix small protein [Betaproteobacteria bacterium]|nr:twin transmembrane helix small protein [Betaproteobacteria bacterium]MBI2290511.1 twin transmembrane helix small protein [Betaproteobacteria bacterium]MBI3056257.1 twin transmembrane helix small protein [Betaproteobacteria bacterium]